MNGIDKFIDIGEVPMHRGVTQIRHLIEITQFLENLGADLGRGNFPPAGLEVVHDFVYHLFQGN